MAMAPTQAVHPTQASAGPAGAAESVELRLLMERLELLSTQRALASVRSQRILSLMETARAVSSSASSPSPTSPPLPSASPSPPLHSHAHSHSPFRPSCSPPRHQHHPVPLAPCPDSVPFPVCATGTVVTLHSGPTFQSARDMLAQSQAQPLVGHEQVGKPRRQSADLGLKRAEEIWAARGDAIADSAPLTRGRPRARRARASLDLYSASSSASPTPPIVLPASPGPLTVLFPTSCSASPHPMPSPYAKLPAGERPHAVSSGAPLLEKVPQRRHSGRRASLNMPRSTGALPTGHHLAKACLGSTSGVPTTEEAYVRSFNSKGPSSSSARYSWSATSSRRRRTVSFDMDSEAAQYYGGGAVAAAAAKKLASPGLCAAHARSPWSEGYASNHAFTATSPWSEGGAQRVGPAGRSPSADVPTVGAMQRAGAQGCAQSFPVPEWAQGRGTLTHPSPCSNNSNSLALSPGPCPQELTYNRKQWQQLMSSDASVRIIDADECPPHRAVQGEGGSSARSCQHTSRAPELVWSGMNGMSSRSNSHSPTGGTSSSDVIMGLPLQPQEVLAFLEQAVSDSEAETSAASDVEGFLGRPSMAQRRM